MIKFDVDEDGVSVEVRLNIGYSSPFARAARLFNRWRKPGYTRRAGMHRGIYDVRDDFDDPLPEDFLISQT
jgi:hypothetical protein